VKRKLILLVIVSIPVLLYLNVWQAFRYRAVETEIELLEVKQQEWIEENKKAIIGIEVLSAPSRINGLTSEIDGLTRPEIPAAIRINIDNSKGGGNG
jgi:cytoskeletal protein RodZ